MGKHKNKEILNLTIQEKCLKEMLKDFVINLEKRSIISFSWYITKL